MSAIVSHLYSILEVYHTVGAAVQLGAAVGTLRINSSSSPDSFCEVHSFLTSPKFRLLAGGFSILLST